MLKITDINPRMPMAKNHRTTSIQAPPKFKVVRDPTKATAPIASSAEMYIKRLI
jgi:hypothetical protein